MLNSKESRKRNKGLQNTWNRLKMTGQKKLLGDGGTFRKRWLVGPWPLPLPLYCFLLLDGCSGLFHMLPATAIQNVYRRVESNGSTWSRTGTSKTEKENKPFCFISWLSLVFVIVTESWLIEKNLNEKWVDSPGTYNYFKFLYS